MLWTVSENKKRKAEMGSGIGILTRMNTDHKTQIVATTNMKSGKTTRSAASHLSVFRPRRRTWESTVTASSEIAAVNRVPAGFVPPRWQGGIYAKTSSQESSKTVT